MIQENEFGAIFISKALQQIDVLRIHLRKSFDDFYVLYRGAHKIGFFYEGRKLAADQQQDCYEKRAPANLNDLEDYINEYDEKIDYYRMSPDGYAFIAEKVIQQQTNKSK